MSNNTKRNVISVLYNNFIAELFKVIDLHELFPVNIDVADLVFNLTFMFPPNCDIKAVINDLIIIHNIQHTDEQLVEAMVIIEAFLGQYNQV